ncbi:MAG: hypothetical protein A2126_03835 [Candidatus Woykebacteria bacterium GWB1_45_5]|uniref:SIS domain-containing protein n=2 Tax=Candidatus Woykeibacteriota TaxID=1817899 RepID=A0A1G1W526_9BACT|nr:MAG: hypothetical protein A2113_02320 [Candidatus Woykebacteria bacterium GWA1_44_8]OGY23614.1 MAG: hypothetical protein A2126_03835 [Candidatus Woykebacteria bacterium GWB1_45_5]
MSNLDDSKKIKELDKENALGSLRGMVDQLKTSWQGSKLVKIPPEYKEVQNIVVTGMGGSGLGGHFLRSVFDIPLPLQIVNDYRLPSFVGEKTLVVVSSYSGGTEETIAALGAALEKKAKIIGVTSGGKLAQDLKQANLPFYQFDPKYNPCGQPRMGLGYSVGGILGFLSQLGLVRLPDLEMEEITNHVASVGLAFDLDSDLEKNPAKAAASKLVGKIPAIVAAEFLVGNAHIFANQVNESAKTFAAYFLLPEINHHLLEGIRFPEGLGEKTKFVFLESGLYSKKIKTRVKITKEVLARAGIESIAYNIKANEKTLAGFEALLFSSWTSFYLAVLNEIDPTPIPNVDFFKEQLAKFA